MKNNKTSAGLNSGNDAEEYVESIMASQRITKVDTPVHSGRKRHLSEPDIVSTVKKQPRILAKAKRTLYTESPQKPRQIVVTSADVHSDGNASVQQLIATLSSDMHMLFSSLSERVEKMEKGLEQKIADKVAKVLDKRVTTEMTRIRNVVDTKVEAAKVSIKEDLKADIDVLHAKIESVASVNSTSTPNDPADDKTLNIVIRDLPESENENVRSKVNKLFKDGLHISDVNCVSADRKKSRNPNKSGVIVAKMNSHDDKRKIMSKKMSLKSHSQYSDVFIQHDQAPAERVLASNFRSILNAMKSHGLTVRGSRVIPRRSRDDGGSSRDWVPRDSRRRGDSPARDQRADSRNRDDSRDHSDRGHQSDRRDHDRGDRDNGFRTAHRGGQRSWRGNGGRGNGGRGWNRGGRNDYH